MSRGRFLLSLPLSFPLSVWPWCNCACGCLPLEHAAVQVYGSAWAFQCSWQSERERESEWFVSGKFNILLHSLRCVRDWQLLLFVWEMGRRLESAREISLRQVSQKHQVLEEIFVSDPHICCFLFFFFSIDHLFWRECLSWEEGAEVSGMVAAHFFPHWKWWLGSFFQEVSGGDLHASSGEVTSTHQNQLLKKSCSSQSYGGWSLAMVVSLFLLLTMQDISCLSYLMAALIRLWNMIQVWPADDM